MEILTLILIGLSLSLDAFTLSLAYGLIGINKIKIILSSIVVGIFHFFMPLVGSIIGSKIFSTLKINPKYIISVVFSLIIIEMIKSLKEKNKEELSMKFINMIGFAFFVSLDSFTVGIGINYITAHPIYASIVFAIISFAFTFVGFLIGKFVSDRIGKISKYIGIVLLLILLIYFLL